MSIFSNPKKGSPDRDPEPEPSAGSIPITTIDLSKWYDLYYTVLPTKTVLLYEDVRILGIRTFERMSKYSSGLIHGYIEIEARDGTRMMISLHLLNMICEHGIKPKYKVLEGAKPDDET